MILTNRIAHAVAKGEVTVAYRRWSHPRVSAGSTFRSVAGVIRIDRVEEIDIDSLQDTDAHDAGLSSLDELLGTFHGRESDPVYRIDLDWVGADSRIDMAHATNLTAGEIDEINTALDRLDRRIPWATATLHQLDQRPGMRAAELAAISGFTKESMKRRVRQLKELGLTISLPDGYEISPRGQAFLRAVAKGNGPDGFEQKVEP